MQKIKSLFKTEYERSRTLIDEIVPGAEWVAAGEGVARRKYDGACCMVRDGKFYKRLTLRLGKALPADFEPLATDEKTGKVFGWIPVTDGPGDIYFREAWDDACALVNGPPRNGTYELIGPKVQGGVENVSSHLLASHAQALEYSDCPRTFNELRDWLAERDIEGVVWHHPDGRMVKMTKKKYGLPRKPASVSVAA